MCPLPDALINVNTTNYINYLTVDIKQDVLIWLQSDRKEDRALSEHLAERFDMAMSPVLRNASKYYLSYRHSRLELYCRSVTNVQGPLVVDFLTPQSLYRFRHDMRIRQPLAKAVGIKKGKRPLICDGTAGLGRDGFILAALGCTVYLLERSFVMWLLLEDGIQRALDHREIGETFSKRVCLVHDDTAAFLMSSSIGFETVYLDPMYPDRTKTALNKQELRYLKDVVGTDTDSAELLEIARTVAEKRTVVKRPAGAPPLSLKPDFAVTGRSTRYDVYLTTS